MDRANAQRWLDAYVHAWLTYDPQEIGALFSDDAEYYYSPFSEVVRGREAIVTAWAAPDRRDAPGTYQAHYEPLAVDGQVVVANGRSRYFEADGTTPTRTFDNIYVIRFDDAGRCTEFKEWYMEVK